VCRKKSKEEHEEEEVVCAERSQKKNMKRSKKEKERTRKEDQRAFIPLRRRSFPRRAFHSDIFPPRLLYAICVRSDNWLPLCLPLCHFSQRKIKKRGCMSECNSISFLFLSSVSSLNSFILQLHFPPENTRFSLPIPKAHFLGSCVLDS